MHDPERRNRAKTALGRVAHRSLVSCTLIGAVLALAGCEDKKAAPPPEAVPPAARATATTPDPAVEKSAVEEEEREPEEIAAQHVLIAYRGAKNAPAGVTRSKSEAKALADEVSKRARTTDVRFEDLATEYSDDDTKHARGSLGKFSKEDMVPAFSEPAFELGVNEISDVVETEFGYHIIKRNQ